MDQWTDYSAFPRYFACLERQESQREVVVLAYCPNCTWARDFRPDETGQHACDRCGYVLSTQLSA